MVKQKRRTPARPAQVKKRKIRKTAKKGPIRRVQKAKRSKRASYLAFRTRKASRIKVTARQTSTILSLDATSGRRIEITEGAQVVPFLSKIRRRMGYPKYDYESILIIVEFGMHSGVEKHRTIPYAGQDAKDNNRGIVLAVNKFLNEGASRTKTSEIAYLKTITIKRISY